MKLKHETRTYTIETLTPLHVGDGNILKTWDIIASGSSVSIYDIGEVIEVAQNNPKALEQFGQENSSLGKFLKDNRLKVKPAYSLGAVLDKPQPNPKTNFKPVQHISVSELRTSMKTGFGKAYIPGSSIKGAIRTALWVSIDRSGLPEVSDRDFDSKVKRIQGQSAHNDFLKPLIVSDSMDVDVERLIVQEVKVKSLKISGPPALKQSIYVEAFPKQSRFSFKIGLNELSQAEMDIFKIKPCPSVTTWADMTKQINVHSKHLAEREQAFFTKHGMDDTAEFYSGLLEKFATLPEGVFILRLSWGSGWKGMTGDWINDDNDLMKVRKKHSLGKTYYECPDCNDRNVKFDKQKRSFICKNFNCKKEHKFLEKKFVDIFPKSRRLALDNGMFNLPMGWVMVMPGDGDTINGRGITEPKLPDNIIVGKQSEAEKIEEKISSFKKNVEASKNISGDI
jgi:CRISPR type III-A-associated RAMP protein Csm5